MRSAGIRELKNSLSRYLRELRPGQTIAITDRGKVVAELRAPHDETTARGTLSGRYEHLVDVGVILRARQSGDPLADWPTARQVKLAPGTAAELIDDDRGG